MTKRLHDTPFETGFGHNIWSLSVRLVGTVLVFRKTLLIVFLFSQTPNGQYNHATNKRRNIVCKEPHESGIYPWFRCEVEKRSPTSQKSSQNKGHNTNPHEFCNTAKKYLGRNSRDHAKYCCCHRVPQNKWHRPKKKDKRKNDSKAAQNIYCCFFHSNHSLIGKY